MMKNKLKDIEEENLVSDYEDEYGMKENWSSETLYEFNYLLEKIQGGYK